MTTATAVHTGATAPTRRADLIGRGLVAFASLGTGLAFLNGLLMTINATDDRLYVEGWRVSSFAIFAGLFALLAFRPRRSAGVWELLIAGKSAVVVFGVLVGNVPEARLAAIIDFVLVVVVASAYVLCRGWLAWRPATIDSIR